MAVRPVLAYPDPCLKRKAEPVTELSPDVLEVCNDLAETMAFHERCVGLAAPQIGISLRILALDVSSHPKGSIAHHGPVVLINPEILESAGSEVGREGCLSLPDITANVPRALRVLFRADLAEGGPLTSFTSGFEARALQHELDHLDGILILDRVVSPAEVFARKGK